MRLSTFITTHLEDILSAWDAQAKRSTIPVDVSDRRALRDHVSDVLRATSHELDAARRAPEANERVNGRKRAGPEIESAGEEHGAERAEVGFTIEQLVSELRSLRSCTVRLWRETNPAFDSDDIDDLARFNDAIDLAIGESVSRYVKEVDRSKETFLGILGHDLRTPLSAIIGSARLMLEREDVQQTARELASRIAQIGDRMNRMISDLLDYSRSRLGHGIPISPSRVDLGKVAREAAQDISASKPGHVVNVEGPRTLEGNWDGRRITQAVTNLIQNAVEHGAKDEPVTVALAGDTDEVTIAVNNRGEPIPSDQLRQIFRPMTSLQAKPPKARDSAHLGLGLYIAQAIAAAHGGRIDVESSKERGTNFTIHLPRAA